MICKATVGSAVLAVSRVEAAVSYAPAACNTTREMGDPCVPMIGPGRATRLQPLRPSGWVLRQPGRSYCVLATRLVPRLPCNRHWPARFDTVGCIAWPACLSLPYSVWRPACMSNLS